MTALRRWWHRWRCRVWQRRERALQIRIEAKVDAGCHERLDGIDCNRAELARIRARRLYHARMAAEPLPEMRTLKRMTRELHGRPDR